jgi:hypothetical protein
MWILFMLLVMWLAAFWTTFTVSVFKAKRTKVIHNVFILRTRVLLATEEMMVQDMTDRLHEIGRRYGMETNVEKTKVMSIPRQPSQIKIRINQKLFG